MTGAQPSAKTEALVSESYNRKRLVSPSEARSVKVELTRGLSRVVSSENDARQGEGDKPSTVSTSPSSEVRVEEHPNSEGSELSKRSTEASDGNGGEEFERDGRDDATFFPRRALTIWASQYKKSGRWISVIDLRGTEGQKRSEKEPLTVERPSTDPKVPRPVHRVKLVRVEPVTAHESREEKDHLW